MPRATRRQLRARAAGRDRSAAGTRRSRRSPRRSRAAHRRTARSRRPARRGDRTPRTAEARHERRRAVDERVVQRRPDLARDLDLVDEAARRDQRDARRAARAARWSRPSCRARARRPDRGRRRRRSRARPRGRIVGRRRDLGDPTVAGDDVGERAAAVDPESHATTLLRHPGLRAKRRATCKHDLARLHEIAASGPCGSRDRPARCGGAGAARARRARCASARRPATLDRRASRG